MIIAPRDTHLSAASLQSQTITEYTQINEKKNPTGSEVQRSSVYRYRGGCQDVAYNIESWSSPEVQNEK